MSFMESFKDSAAILVAIFLVIVPLVYMVMYPGVPIPDTIITWATYAIQFLFGIGSMMYGGRIAAKAFYMQNPSLKKEDG